MPRTGAGVYELPPGTDDFVANTVIESGKIDSLTADLAADLNAITNGTDWWTGQFKGADGTVSLPGLSFNSDTDSGWYRVGANNIALSLGGAKVIDYLTTGATFLLSDDGAAAGPDVTIDRVSASPAASDALGRLVFSGRDSGAAVQTYASIEATITDPTAASEDGNLLLKNVIAGTLTTQVTLNATGVLIPTLTLTNALGVASGGTGLASFTSGDIIYASGTTTLAKLAKGTANQVLSMNGGATAPTWTTSIATVATQAEQETGSSLTAGVTPGRQQFHQSAAKCWAYVTVSGGTPTLVSSYNITSITDTATGRLTITIGTDFSSANWACIPSITNTQPTPTTVNVSDGTMAAGSVEIYCRDVGASLADPKAWSMVGFGDQ